MSLRFQAGLALAFAWLAFGCAQVPRESVTLSETVGRDVTAIQTSHVKFVNLVYDGYEKDVNTFVDDVYIPFFFHEDLKKESSQKMMNALQQAGRNDSTDEQRTEAYQRVGLWLTVAQRHIDNMRTKLLVPLKDQRRKILADLDDAYGRVLKANAAVTGYVASIAKVTDLQNDLLEKLGLPNLSERVGDAALQVSTALAEGLPEAEKKLKEAEELRNKLQEYIKRWKKEETKP